MRYSLTIVCSLIFIIIISIFIANVANLISIDEKLVNKNINKINDDYLVNQKRNLHIDDGQDQLIWFIQISDLHISIFGDHSRISQLKDFVTTTIDTIKPVVVLASGDLTDAKENNFIGSRQFEKEWQIYQDVLKMGDVESKTLWLDLRGNHDNFNVPGAQSQINYFQQYSVQGKANKRSYMKQITKHNIKYSFIAIDACLEPGPKRPFNFIGLLTINDTNDIIRLANEAREMGGDYIIWFGHYPTSCIVSEETGSWGLRKLIGKYSEGFTYLCGHLHTFGNTVRNMYTLQDDGFLELELGDWRANRMYRIAAIDHGLFSFIDVKQDEWPIILVTNPKHALFNIPDRENPKLQLESTYIRILAFSPENIINCTIQINNENWQECYRKSDNLYVIKWNPYLYAHGVHTLNVRVFDGMGRMKMVTQPFSLDGSRLTFGLAGRLILMSNVSNIFRGLFIFAVVLCILPLITLRIWHALVLSQKLKYPRMKNGFIRRFWVLSTVNRISIPIVIYCVYLTFGPWSIGEVIDGYNGYIFAWGIYINGGYLPGSLTYLYGCLQLLLCQWPLILIFSHAVDARFCRFVGIPRKQNNFIYRKIKHIPFILIILIELFLALLFWYSYGILAFLIGPFRTWSVLLNVLLWYLSRNLPETCFRSASLTWCSTNRKLSEESEHQQQDQQHQIQQTEGLNSNVF